MNPVPADTLDARRPDYLLLASTVALLVLGSLMVYSASFVVAHNEFNDDAYFLNRQLLWIAVGGVAVGDNAAAGRFDDTHDNADRLLLLINTFYENRANFVSSKNWQLLEDIRIHKF